MAGCTHTTTAPAPLQASILLYTPTPPTPAPGLQAGISLYDAELAMVPAGSGGGAGGGGKKKKKGARAQRAQRTAMLFTHRGFSGPAVLDLSDRLVRPLERGQEAPVLSVQWTPLGPAEWEARLLEGGASLAVGALRREGLPQRLAEALCEEAGVPLDRWVGAGGRYWVGLGG